MIPPRIKDVKALDDFILEIVYVTGEKKQYDMKKQIDFNYYKNLRNLEYFKLVKSAETTLEWPNGEDIDPNELYNNSISLD